MTDRPTYHIPSDLLLQDRVIFVKCDQNDQTGTWTDGQAKLTGEVCSAMLVGPAKRTRARGLAILKIKNIAMIPHANNFFRRFHVSRRKNFGDFFHFRIGSKLIFDFRITEKLISVFRTTQTFISVFRRGRFTSGAPRKCNQECSVMNIS